MAKMTCAHCGQACTRPTGQINRRIRAGKPTYCSRLCGNAARSARKLPVTQWHERRFDKRPGTIEKACTECGRQMWLPPSKAEEYKRCGIECNRAWRERTKRVVVIRGKPVPLERQCETCGAPFRPRPVQVRDGGGRYCSRQCIPAHHLSTPENLALAQQRRREAQAAGLIDWKTGPAHHSWKGGTEAHKERQRSPEVRRRQREALRVYRAKNRDKVREWKQRRSNGKVLPRLPWGTIPRLGDAQKWRCAICRVSIRDHYHVDHIHPIAKGGKHEPRNLQLLCPTCNVRKSAKDPIQYMQELGRLL